VTLPLRVVPPSQAAIPAWCVREQVAASHLVAHDSVRRGPRERAQMLREIGVRRIIWDWRDEHLETFDAELDALRAHQVELAGIWTPLPMPAFEEPDYAARFGLVPARIKTLITEAARRGFAPDLWTQIAFGTPGAPAPLSEAAHRSEVNRAADHLTGLIRLARGHGMCVVLTNHGGWAGEPQTLKDVVTELARRGLGNVGLGFRLQHAHHLIPDLDRHLATMGEHLVALMLSGADAGAELSGRVILPFGAGSRDRWVTHAILDSGWQGQLVVHAVGTDDSRSRLLDSLEGWEWAVDRALGHPRERPTPRILEPTWPPGPAWTGRVVAAPASPSASAASTAHTAPPTNPSAPPATPAVPAMPTPAPASAAALWPGRNVGPDGAPPAPRPAPTSADAAASFAAAWAAATAQASGARAAAQAHVASAPPLTPTRPTPPAATHTLGHAAAAAAPEYAQTPLAQRQAPADPYVGLSRRERRVMHDQHEAAARNAARTVREQERAASRDPGRIGHNDVSIIAPDPYSGALHALLLHLEDAGFTGAPRSFGWDDKGRHLVEFVPGMRADHPKAPDEALDPARIGRFIRKMHDALESFEPPDFASWFSGIPAPGNELIVHHDLAPSNIVVRADGSLVAIDWDAAGPGTRLWDLAYAAHSFAPLYRADADVVSASHRMRRLVDGYGLDDAGREELVPLLAMRSERMYEYLDHMRTTGRSPWVELWQRGVGTVWKSDSQWIRDRSETWRAALLA